MKTISFIIIILSLVCVGCQRTYDTQADDTEYIEEYMIDHEEK